MILILTLINGFSEFNRRSVKNSLLPGIRKIEVIGSDICIVCYHGI